MLGFAALAEVATAEVPASLLSSQITLTGSSSLIAIASGAIEIQATLAASSQFSAIPGSPGQAALAASSTLNASAFGAQQAVATLAGSAQFSASTTTSTLARATLAGFGQFTAVQGILNAALLTGSSSLTAIASGPLQAIATLASSSQMTGAGVAGLTGLAFLPAISSLTVATLNTLIASATLAASSRLTTTATGASQTLAILAASSQMVAAPGSAQALAKLAGSSQVSAVASIAQNALATLAGSSSSSQIASLGRGFLQAQAILAASSRLSAVATSTAPPPLPIVTGPIRPPSGRLVFPEPVPTGVPLSRLVKPEPPLPQVFVREVASIFVPVDPDLFNLVTELIFTRPDGTKYVVDRTLFYPTYTFGLPHMVYTTAANELNIFGWWTVQYATNTGIVPTVTFAFYIFGTGIVFGSALTLPVPPILPPVSQLCTAILGASSQVIGLATGTSRLAISATLSASAQIIGLATGGRGLVTRATLSASAQVIAISSGPLQAIATLAGTGSSLISAPITKFIQATLAASSTITAIYTSGLATQATILSSFSLLRADTVSSLQGRATLAGAGSTLGSAPITRFIQATLAASSQLSNVANMAMRTQATLVGTSTQQDSPPTVVATLVFADSSPTLTFADAAATPIGTWTNPNTGKVQNIRRITNGFWTVYFRPEADGSRHEIVFEWGALLPGDSTTQKDQGAYTCTITGLGGPIVINVPNHWWRARWRWQSAPRPFTANVSDMLTSKKIPPYASSTIPFSTYSGDVFPGSFPAYTPMTNVGIFQYMPNTGERDDIGPLTEHCARAIFYLLGLPGGSAISVQIMMDQAEASGSIPWHLRDETTGLPINYNSGNNVNYSANVVNAFTIYGTTGSGFTIDVEHKPCLSYLPYLLTGDLWHLEELQFVHTHDMVWSRFDAGSPGAARLTNGTTRAQAWMLRNMVYAASTAPTSDTSGCLLNQAYLNSIVTNTHDYWYVIFVNSTEPWQAVFGSIGDFQPFPPFVGEAPFQFSFHLAMCCQAVDLGYTIYTAARDRVFNGIVNFANGVTWDRHMFPYIMPAYEYPANTVKITSWAQQTSTFEASMGSNYPLASSTTYYTVEPGQPATVADMSYPNYLRGGLLWAQYQGASTGDSITFLTNALTNWNFPDQGLRNAKWHF